MTVVLHLTEEIVMGGDQGLVVEKEIGIEGQHWITVAVIDAGGQDQAVRKGVDDHQDPVVQIEEAVTVPHQGITEGHPQGEGLRAAY